MFKGLANLAGLVRQAQQVSGKMQALKRLTDLVTGADLAIMGHLDRKAHV